VVTIDDTLLALAHEARRDIIASLGDGPRPAGQLGRELPISRPAVSKHLRVLREAGLVESTKVGRQQLYHLTPEGLTQLQKTIEEMGRFWSNAFGRFKAFAESDQPKTE
jgi:DNA-binding transcriptional ArsR family regulator